MNYNNDDDMWDWRCNEYSLEDNTNLDISKCLFNEEVPNQGFSYMLEDETTPVKACGDLAYHVNPITEKSSKDLSQYKEASLQVKRRRMLQFEPGDLDLPFCNESSSSLYLRSKELEVDPVGDVASEMSEWVAGFAEGTSASGDDILDHSSEGWLADCFNDTEMQFSTADINASGASGVQINITELCGTSAVTNAAPQRPVRTRRNVVFKGRKSYMQTPPKLASSVVYPFAFIKPCGVHGDVTLKDINQRILNPTPKLKQNKEDLEPPYPTSAFSGKPVVGKTKIRTEGGSITIMRTKG
ncbi:OLC1v1019977C1 [Oldenlandia corymbosa var. corymbosa]|uniref:OLC1v1019977C1 n=1 Tax=Oldenlandia corymbosa var. corymbosa TaxID=529605 RepID=A0AAV1EF82_OLDCO|nr:OLC1v1019977C1 [Oldenlandia corymbosa var. corymbosa]